MTIDTEIEAGIEDLRKIRDRLFREGADDAGLCVAQAMLELRKGLNRWTAARCAQDEPPEAA